MRTRVIEIEWLENMRGALVRGINAHLSLRKRHEIMAYAMGLEPPHYSVPAPLVVWESETDPDGNVYVVAYVDETNGYAVEYVRGMAPNRLSLAHEIPWTR